jgi:hypothetical protein
MDGYIYPLSYYTFYRVADLFIQFPHVLPIDAAEAMPGIRLAWGPYCFYLDYVHSSPRILQYDLLLSISRSFDRSDYYQQQQQRDICETIGRNYGVEGRCQVFTYLWDAALRLNSQLTEYVIDHVPKYTTLSKVPRFSVLSTRAADYLAHSTHTDLKAIPGIVNEVKKHILKVEDPGYKRITKLDRITTYTEPPNQTVYGVSQPTRRI